MIEKSFIIKADEEIFKEIGANFVSNESKCFDCVSVKISWSKVFKLAKWKDVLRSCALDCLQEIGKCYVKSKPVLMIASFNDNLKEGKSPENHIYCLSRHTNWFEKPLCLPQLLFVYTQSQSCKLFGNFIDRLLEQYLYWIYTQLYNTSLSADLEQSTEHHPQNHEHIFSRLIRINRFKIA